MKTKLAVFDLDDTLVAHNREMLKIYVRNSVTNELIKTIPYQYYLDFDHKLPVLAKGFHYDFSDFECPYIFSHTAKPKETMINVLKEYWSKNDTDVVILTIRSTPTDPVMFKNVLVNFEIPHSIPIIFAGDTYPGEDAPEKKYNAVKKLQEQNYYKEIVFYDDSLDNVNKVGTLNCNDFNVSCYLVHEDW